MKVVGKKHYKQYTLKQIIGSGSFGKVYNSPPYAIKQMCFQGLSKFIVNSLQNQIKILNSIKHQNIVKLVDHFRQGANVYLVMEYCDMDLSKYLKKNDKQMNEEKAIKILKQILLGFRQLVKQGIIHRDLKPANILVTSKEQFKLADFGFAKFVSHYDSKLLYSIVGTPLYMAPQILAKKEYTTKCDIWSIGFIFYEMLTGTFPWMGVSQADLLKNITNRPLSIPDNLSKYSKNLLSKMLKINQKQRISWQQLFNTVLQCVNTNIDIPLAVDNQPRLNRRDSQKQNDKNNTAQKRRAYTPGKPFKITQQNKEPKTGNKTERRKTEKNFDPDFITCYQNVFTDLIQIELERLFDEQCSVRICKNLTGAMCASDREKFNKALTHFNADFQKAAYKIWNLSPI